MDWDLRSQGDGDKAAAPNKEATSVAMDEIARRRCDWRDIWGLPRVGSQDVLSNVRIKTSIEQSAPREDWQWGTGISKRNSQAEARVVLTSHTTLYRLSDAPSVSPGR